MYGIETPEDVAAKRQAMTHSAGDVQSAPEPVTNFGRQAAGLAGPDPELEALAQQAGDAPPVAPRVAPGTEALGGAMEGNLADVEHWQRQRQGLGPVVTRSRNEAYPIVQRQGQEMLAGEGQMPQRPEFTPEPFVTPTRNPGESDADFMSRVELMKMNHDAGQMEAAQAMEAQYQEAAGVPMARDVGQDDNIGMNEAQRRTQEVKTEAELQQNERMAAAEANAAMARQEQIEASRIALQEERDFQQDMRARLLQAQDVEVKARQKLEAMPGLEGQRYTKNLPLGKKILFAISAAADGWAGKSGTVDLLKKMNQEELEEQKLAHEMGIQSYDAAKGAVDQGMNLYGMLQNQMTDPVASEMMFLNLLDEDEVAMLREEAAKTTEPIRRQEILQQAQQIEQGLRDRRDQTQLRVAQAHEYNYKKSDPHRREREFAEEQLGESLKAQRSLRERGVDIGMAREKQEGAMELEGAKSRGAASTARAKVEAESEAKIKERTQTWGGIERQIDDILTNTGEIHGRGLPGTGDSDERATTDSQLTALKASITNAWTGAVASPEQEAEFRRLIEGDWSEWSDKALRARLRALKNIVSSQRRYLQESIGSSDAQATSTKEFKSFRPQ
jgi:hypothetical protein